MAVISTSVHQISVFSYIIVFVNKKYINKKYIFNSVQCWPSITKQQWAQLTCEWEVTVICAACTIFYRHFANWRKEFSKIFRRNTDTVDTVTAALADNALTTIIDNASVAVITAITITTNLWERPAADTWQRHQSVLVWRLQTAAFHGFLPRSQYLTETVCLYPDTRCMC